MVEGLGEAVGVECPGWGKRTDGAGSEAVARAQRHKSRGAHASMCRYIIKMGRMFITTVATFLRNPEYYPYTAALILPDFDFNPLVDPHVPREQDV